MKGSEVSELLIVEITGVKNTPSKISTHPRPRLRLYIFVFFLSPFSRSVSLFPVNLKAILRLSDNFILLLRRDAARLLDVSNEG